MAKCPYCGRENPDESKFCAWCGREKPDTMYLNADQFSEPWTYVPPSPAGQTQPGAFDPAQPIEGARPAPAPFDAPKPAASDPWAATQAAAPAATSATSASDPWKAAMPTAQAATSATPVFDPWKAAMPTAQAEPMKTSAPQEPPKAKNKLLILLPFAAVILVIVIAALVVPRLSSRQTPREAENDAPAAAPTAVTAAAVDWTDRINKPAAELRNAQHWSDDTADYAFYIENGDSRTNVYVVITNKTDKDISINLTVRAKNASGAFVGEDKRAGWVVGLGAGCSTMVSVLWLDLSSVASIELEPEYSDPPSWWKDIVPDLTVKAAPYTDDYDSGVNLDLTNHGSGAAENVFIQCLFFDAHGNLCDYSNGVVDSIATGATGSSKLDCYEPFEMYEIYVTGYYAS